MFEYYWQSIVEHRHDIMIPILIIYLVVDKFVDRWFWINWFRKEYGDSSNSLLTKEGK